MSSPISTIVDVDGQRYGKDALVGQLRAWLKEPRVNEVLLARRIFANAREVLLIWDALPTFSQKQLAMVVERLLSSRYVRRRIIALVPRGDRGTVRSILEDWRLWAMEAANASPLALPN
jgi:hypothetical protein